MNRELLKQVLDALKLAVLRSEKIIDKEYDAAIAALEAELAKPEPEPVAWLHTAKYKIPGVVQPTWLSFHPKDKHSQSAAPLYAAPTELNEIERLYKNALKREFELSQALKVSIDSNLDKLMGMSDEQIRALAGFDGHHHDDLAALARQTFEIALLKAELAKHSEPHIPAPRGFIAQPSIDGVVRTNTTNCNRHPYAPHGPDGAGCKCHSWSPGDAS